LTARLVSVDGATYDLARPFFVLATMNPVERFGSFELPESQLDRFMLSISLGYPERGSEREILARDMRHIDAEELVPVSDAPTIQALQEKVRLVKIENSIMDYLLDLIGATRQSPDIKLGLSSRAGLHLKRAMQAMALLEDRTYVVPQDLRRIFIPVSLHRILLAGGVSDYNLRERKVDVLNRLLESTPGPV
jgi:MoxR-like ATPase